MGEPGEHLGGCVAGEGEDLQHVAFLVECGALRFVGLLAGRVEGIGDLVRERGQASGRITARTTRISLSLDDPASLRTALSAQNTPTAATNAALNAPARAAVPSSGPPLPGITRGADVQPSR